MRKFTLIAVAVLHLLLADAVTKELTLARFFEGESVPVINGFFNLAHVQNRGCAWGMFQGHVWPLAVFGIVAIALIAWRRDDFFPRGKNGRRMPYCGLAECLLYAGILGNLIDRIFRGYVVDFFDFHWGEAYHFPCFNLADTYICLAVGIVLLQSFRMPSEPKKAKADS